MEAVLEALGHGDGGFQVLLVQFVSLMRGGETVQMSTRSGKFVTLADVVKEVGVDATRFFFLMRSSNSHLDFDLELAKKETQENPVYYIQYAHARICSLHRMAEEKGVPRAKVEGVNLERLDQDEDFSLIKKCLLFPEVVGKSAESREIHRISYYLQELVAQFHSYYSVHRVVSEDKELTQARLLLLECVRSVIANGLEIMGVSAPEKM